MDREAVYVAVDVGTTKVTALVGLVHLNGTVEVTGLGVTPSRGLSKGVIVNIEEAQESVRTALEEAAHASGQIVRHIYATVTGTHLQFSTRWGTIRSPHYSVPISYVEVDRAVEAAYPAELPPERQVLHLVPRSYAVDGLKGVRNPIGMHALRLDVETLCISGATAQIRNLARAIEHNRVRVGGLIMSALAAGEAVLTRDEREMGVLLLEIGGGVTTVAAFSHDSLSGAGVLPVGGYNCTNDLAVALSTPPDVAEDLKLRHGHLLPEGNLEQRVEIPSFGDGVGIKIDRHDLARYLRDRIEEILRMCLLQARTMGYAVMPPAGVVITGGTANLPGLQVLARRMFNCPVRIGGPRGVEGLPEELTNPSYAAAVGTLLWGTRNHTVRAIAQHHSLNGNLFKAKQAGTPPEAVLTNGSTGLTGREMQSKAMAWIKERAKRVAL